MRPTGFQVEEQVYASDPDFIKAPSESDMMKGVKPLDTLPAAWWNWLWNQATKQDNNIFLDVNDLRQEILSVLNAAGITPSASATNQLLQSIVRINQTIATATVPGSVISSSDIRSVSVDPVTGQMLVNALSDWASEDTIKKALDALRTAVEQEVTDRKAAITAEAKARTDADTTLQANISTLSNKLSTETGERKATDTTLQANIDKKNDKITTTTDYDASLTDDNTWATPTIIGTNPTKFFVRKLSQLWSYISNKIGFPLAISKGGTGGISESTAVNNLLVRKAVDAETDLKNLPVATGCYPVTHTGFSGSAFVFYAAGSRSNLGFLLRGGGTTAPEVLSALDSSPSKWTNHGRMITKDNAAAEISVFNTNLNGLTPGVPTGRNTAKYYLCGTGEWAQPPIYTRRAGTTTTAVRERWDFLAIDFSFNTTYSFMYTNRNGEAAIILVGVTDSDIHNTYIVWLNRVFDNSIYYGATLTSGRTMQLFFQNRAYNNAIITPLFPCNPVTVMVDSTAPTHLSIPLFTVYDNKDVVIGRDLTIAGNLYAMNRMQVSSEITIPTSAPSSPVNGDIWIA